MAAKTGTGRPGAQAGRCDRCRQKKPVRPFKVMVGARTAVDKKLCDDCIPPVVSGIITMIH